MQTNSELHLIGGLANRPTPIPAGLRVCLVSAPTATDFDDASVAESDHIRLLAEHAPVGILSLAAVLEQYNVTARIIDLNDWYYQFLRAGKRTANFCEFAATRFQDLSFDIIGFSTICSSYPLTLRIAERVKATHPGAAIVLGGPQASVTDVAAMQAFPFIDYVVRGEAEETFPSLLSAVARDDSVDSIPGITYRNRGKVVRKPNAPVIENLDDLPLPAFELCPHLKESRYIPLELGRGCPFACKFCSTNDFFRRNFRLKSPATMLRQMKAVKEAYRVQTFDLIHDMFTVDRKRVVAFCEALLESGEEFYWNCSARTDCIDEQLIELMESAGCRGIFFGIETGSQRLQRVVQKRLNLSEAIHMIECTDTHHIRTAVSLISGFPDETRHDLRDTTAFFVDALRYDYAQPQLHILAPLAETPIEVEFRDQLTFDCVISDMSYQGWRQDPADLEMIQSYRDIFPNFYAVPTPGLDRQHLKEFRDFLLNGAVRFRWLLVALQQELGDLVAVFDRWRLWRRNAPRPDESDVHPYYSSATFRSQFLSFVAEECVPTAGERAAGITAVLDYESTVPRGAEECVTPSIAPGASGKRQPIGPGSVPVVSESVKISRSGRNYYDLIHRLRRKVPLTDLPQQEVTLAFRKNASGGLDVIQLSETSAQMLSMCDGTRRVMDISNEFSAEDLGIEGIDPSKACIFGLEMLRIDGLIELTAAQANT